MSDKNQQMLKALDHISHHAYDEDTPAEDVKADFDRMRGIASDAVVEAGLSATEHLDLANQWIERLQEEVRRSHDEICQLHDQLTAKEEL